MRKFTLTAMAIKDAQVVAVFQILEQIPRLDGEEISTQLSEFLKQPYQAIVYGPYPPIFLHQDIVNSSDFVDAGAEVVAFSVWRAATGLRNNRALEIDNLKHGSNWLVKLDDEPFEVKFVLEDQAQNYLLLNALPTLESTVVISESGWLATAAPEDKFSNEFGDKGVVVESGAEGFTRSKELSEREQALGQLGYQSPVVEETDEVVLMSNDSAGKEEPRISNFGHDQTSEGMRIAFRNGFLGRDRNVADADAGLFEKPISEGYAESLSEVLEQVDQSRSASKALLGEQNPVHNHYVNGDDIQTTHTELNSPSLEI